MASLIMVYGVVLAGLAFTARSLVPEAPKNVFIVGIAGGSLCVCCGLAALAGYKRRVWTILTLMAVFLVALADMIQAWLGNESDNYSNPLLLTVMLLMTVGMLLYVMHGERPADFYTVESPGKPAARERR